MGDVPEPTVRVTRYEVSCLPEDLSDAWAGNFTVTVEYRGEGLWSVSQGEHRKLGADGTWSWGYRWQEGTREPVTDEERDDYERGRGEWLAAHRFDEETALRLAREAAPLLKIRDFTVADALAEAVAEADRER